TAGFGAAFRAVAGDLRSGPVARSGDRATTWRSGFPGRSRRPAVGPRGPVRRPGHNVAFRAVAGDLRSGPVARSGDRATTCGLLSLNPAFPLKIFPRENSFLSVEGASLYHRSRRTPVGAPSQLRELWGCQGSSPGKAGSVEGRGKLTLQEPLA